MYVNMIKMLKDAENGGYAVGAFNIVNRLTAKAVVDQAEEMRSPVILQTSQKTVEQITPEGIVDFVKPMAERAGIPVALHLDHCTKPELAKRCVDVGYSSIMIDMSKKPLDENIAVCREVAEYAHRVNVSVEGEIGAIVGVEDNIVVSERESALADLDSSALFTKETDIDFLAPAIGTAHGLYKGEPKIEFELFEELRKVIPVPLVIHGGTGLADEVFKKLISMGAAKINISTALKLAYMGGLKKYFAENEKHDPLKTDMAAYLSVREMAASHIKLFGSEGKV